MIILNWSFSSDRTFNKCPRKWFYHYRWAHHSAKAISRQRAYRLSKLQSISSWRGLLVDKVISNKVVKNINDKRHVDFNNVISYAKRLFEAELEFALAHRLLDDDIKPSQETYFTAFFNLEYGLDVYEEEIDAAWADIELAISNLFNNDYLFGLLTNANYLKAQHTFQFRLDGFLSEVNFKGSPDLIIFNQQEPPIIVDWKVKTSGLQDYWLQLASYAVAITKSPHNDMISYIYGYKTTDIPLIEAQLLTGETRKYQLNETDVESVEDYIATSATKMLHALDGRQTRELAASDFEVAYDAVQCSKCPFQSLCWESN